MVGDVDGVTVEQHVAFEDAIVDDPEVIEHAATEEESEVEDQLEAWISVERPCALEDVEEELHEPPRRNSRDRWPLSPAAPGRAARWCISLLGKHPQDLKNQSCRPYSTWAASGELTEPNQRVIKADCERTRGDTEYFRRPDIRSKMESMLTCWCQEQGVRYKQGLNEVLAPFIYLQTTVGEASPDDDQVYLCFRSFLRRYVPFFDSEDFIPLQCAFVFFRRLLLYHHPDLHNLLVERGISPDMFCTPWFLTLFASKMGLRLTYQLWDRIVDRGEAQFFVFLAVAVVANAKQAIFAAERSLLPEILASLGMLSEEDLESIWTIAERLQHATPVTFVARLKRNVLRSSSRVTPGPSATASSPSSATVRAMCESSPARLPGQGTEGTEEARETPQTGEQIQGNDKESQRTLERLEQERCFFVLPDEVVGNCYPPTDSENSKPWHLGQQRDWRLVLLDLRPLQEYEVSRLPASMRFDLSGDRSGNSPTLGGGYGAAGVPNGGNTNAGANAPGGFAAAARNRLSQWRQRSTGKELDAGRVFEALKSSLGEDWVCDKNSHICLIGSAASGSLVRQLYEVMTQQLTLWHVSVASGGYEALLECVGRQDLEVIQGKEMKAGGSVDDRWSSASERSSSKGTSDSNDGLDGDAANPRKLLGLNVRSFQPFAQAANSVIRKASDAAGAAAARAAAAATAATASANNNNSSNNAPRGASVSSAPGTRGSVSEGGAVTVPTLRDRPGNWHLQADMGLLPRRSREDLEVGTDERAAKVWPGIAVMVKDYAARKGAFVLSNGKSWAGCACMLMIQQDGLLLWTESGDDKAGACVLAECSVSRVLRVTSKKHAPEVLIFYFRPDSNGAEEVTESPGWVVHFSGGSEAVQGFISTLRASYPVESSSSEAQTADVGSENAPAPA